MRAEIRDKSRDQKAELRVRREIVESEKMKIESFIPADRIKVE